MLGFDWMSQATNQQRKRLFSDDVGYWETHQEGDGEIMEAISFLLHDEGRPNGGAGVNNADIDYQDIKVEPIKCDFATKKKMKIGPCKKEKAR
mmetsp:Transcript_43495/g.69593  ORF Transcript_43495/g.69593 Transcript_43495/m.69593 type:complete len:93 (+) Transcript_43495:304-582(+)